jgi:ABC-2 type transport system ATP-binding protein
VRRIGVVFGQRTQLWWDLPVIESFDLLRDIYSVNEASYRRTKDQLIELLDLRPLLDVPVRQLSLGQRMRCDLAASLLHEPDILFLDEPTIGLDADAKLKVREFIAKMHRERSVTVILTTHDMDDIEALCRRVLLIGSGRILLDGPLAELRARISPERRLVVDLEEPGEIAVDGARLISIEGRRAHLSFDPTKVPAPELIARVTSLYRVLDLFVVDPPIEEIVARIYAEHGGRR